MNIRSLSADVVVIGAGPAGLTAAYLLSKQGQKVVVVEKDPVHVGGISRTVAYKGFRFDIGGHRFFSKSREVVDLWNELLPDDFIERRRLSRILYDGKFYSYPLRAGEALNNLGVFRSLYCMASFAKAKLLPIREVRSFRDWTVNQFGEALFEIFFKSYTEKVWGIPCEEISADWAAQRIRSLNLWSAVSDSLLRSMGLQKWRGKGAGPTSLIESFRYPRLGPGMMWDAARARVEAAGNSVVMGHEVTGLSHDPESGRWTVTAKGGEGGGLIVEATHVISSAPIRDLAACLLPQPVTLPQATELKYRDFLTVALIIESRNAFPDNWIYIHDPRVKVGRIQNYRSWSPEMVPDQALSCLGLEYFCFEGDDLWSAADQDLIQLARRELELLGLCRPGSVLDATVVRQEKAYPVYDEGYAARVGQVRKELELRFPTLHLVGRNGMHRYNNQDHSMLTAMLTVRNIVAGRRICDVWAVNEEAEYHESGGDAPKPEGARGQRLVPRRLSGEEASKG